jgi:hypothetical protein
MLELKRGLAGALAVIGCVSLLAEVSCGSTPGGDDGGPGESSPMLRDATAGDANEPAAPDASTGQAGFDATSQADDAAAPGDAGAGPGSEDGGAQASDGGLGVAEDAAGPAVDAACTPATGCPKTAGCGHYTDPCTGQVFACGTACTGGNVCVTNPADQNAETCQPKTCAGRCGVIGVDGCGVAVGCGGCAAGMACIANHCAPAGVHDAGQCAPLTCTPGGQSHLCGTITDGCGNTQSCSCPSGQVCGGGVCMAKPPECSGDAGALCGSVTNACGSGTVACGGCATGTHCAGNVCTTCTAPSCGAATCGQATNACGQSVTCGTSCPNNEICDNGACCTPQTCATVADAGTGCNPVDLGCGVKKSCNACPTGQICTNDTCVVCVPKTCADFGDAGCGHSDGCGKTFSCCGAGTTCQSSLCCPEGQVNYNNSCCQPACDPTQASGPQTSCGQVIFCSG